MAEQHPNFIQSYFHGTKASLQVGDLIVPGKNANYGERIAKFVYASSNLNVAIWGAELAVGEGPGRIYVVEPIGTVERIAVCLPRDREHERWVFKHRRVGGNGKTVGKLAVERRQSGSYR